MKILFWNTHKNKEIDPFIIDLTEQYSCDIIILAEYTGNINGLCNQLSLLQMDFYLWQSPACDKIRIISKKCYRNQLMQDEKRYCIFGVETAYGKYILTALHLPCKMYFEHPDIEFYARRIRNDIEHVEEKLGHRNSFVVGDFNVNPFENACINADCFHALPDRREAGKGYRTVEGVSFTTFYNPMWNLFGDADGVSGTYFYNKNQIRLYQWNIYDQVILRPDLTECFVFDSLKIIDHMKGNSILNKNGTPDRKISDHLPIYFEIREEM